MPNIRSLAQEVIGPDEAAVTAEFIAFLEAASRRRASGRVRSGGSTRGAPPVA